METSEDSGVGAVDVTEDATTAVTGHESDDKTGDSVNEFGGDGSARSTAGRPVRGRYAKFTAGMDVLLLEAMRTHNPFTAKHGTRLQMWQNIAEIVGETLMKNPEAYSWHTCRDRVTTLMKLYADGKHDKLFKHGSAEENAQKETILREMNLLLQRRNSKSGGFRTSALLEGHTSGHHSSLSTGLVLNGNGKDRKSAGAGQKRRRGESGLSSKPDGEGLDGETFRSRVLELIETKIQFDMEQRIKENDLREQEFELQKRFLEYLQSK
ncbi:hypothetical protein Poli38472_012794 [Pythium oligandrum]|uniref:Uncharacterized protein n=1 Tax=Pythium oligandrum TaxID=41045 RepID=A0A8K1FKC8_PYTOL|nr:hypothetical protein Poli38472_012794 [Pythium oligandrum]|eukprot:TMW61603.1 hypothetical protein Poli38472_012794 [Pythium oligandrum]